MLLAFKFVDLLQCLIDIDDHEQHDLANLLCVARQTADRVLRDKQQTDCAEYS